MDFCADCMNEGRPSRAELLAGPPRTVTNKGACQCALHDDTILAEELSLYADLCSAEGRLHTCSQMLFALWGKSRLRPYKVGEAWVGPELSKKSVIKISKKTAAMALSHLKLAISLLHSEIEWRNDRTVGQTVGQKTKN